MHFLTTKWLHMEPKPPCTLLPSLHLTSPGTWSCYGDITLFRVSGSVTGSLEKPSISLTCWELWPLVSDLYEILPRWLPDDERLHLGVLA